MTTAIIMFIILVLLCIAFSFGFACLLTWAVCFIAGLFGVTLAFSWKLVLAIWIIASLISSAKTVNVKVGN